jgi:hypothetical protein
VTLAAALLECTRAVAHGDHGCFATHPIIPLRTGSASTSVANQQSRLVPGWRLRSAEIRSDEAAVRRGRCALGISCILRRRSSGSRLGRHRPRRRAAGAGADVLLPGVDRYGTERHPAPLYPRGLLFCSGRHPVSDSPARRPHSRLCRVITKCSHLHRRRRRRPRRRRGHRPCR